MRAWTTSRSPLSCASKQTDLRIWRLFLVLWGQTGGRLSDPFLCEFKRMGGRTLRTVLAMSRHGMFRGGVELVIASRLHIACQLRRTHRAGVLPKLA